MQGKIEGEAMKLNRRSFMQAMAATGAGGMPCRNKTPRNQVLVDDELGVWGDVTKWERIEEPDYSEGYGVDKSMMIVRPTVRLRVRWADIASSGLWIQRKWRLLFADGYEYRFKGTLLNYEPLDEKSGATVLSIEVHDNNYQEA